MFQYKLDTWFSNNTLGYAVLSKVIMLHLTSLGSIKF